MMARDTKVCPWLMMPPAVMMSMIPSALWYHINMNNSVTRMYAEVSDLSFFQLKPCLYEMHFSRCKNIDFNDRSFPWRRGLCPWSYLYSETMLISLIPLPSIGHGMSTIYIASCNQNYNMCLCQQPWWYTSCILPMGIFFSCHDPYCS